MTSPIRIFIPEDGRITLTIDEESVDLTSSAETLILLGLQEGSQDPGPEGVTFGVIEAEDGITFGGPQGEIPAREALQVLSDGLVVAIRHALDSFKES